MALPKEVSLIETVEITLGGQERHLYYPLDALEHFRLLTGKSWRRGWRELIEVERDEKTGALHIDCNERYLLAFITAGLICETPMVKESEVRGWIKELIAAERADAKTRWEAALGAKITELETEAAQEGIATEKKHETLAVIAELRAEREAGCPLLSNDVMLGLASLFREAMYRAGNARRPIERTASSDAPAEDQRARPTEAALAATTS